MNITNETKKLSGVKRFFIIEAIAFFIVLFAINLFIFWSMLSGPALIVATIITWIVTVVVSSAAAAKYARLNSLHSDGKRKINHYFKRAWVIIILMTLFSFGLSLVCGFITNFIVGIMVGRTNIHGIFFTLPLFVLYLACVYRTFIKLGFDDAQKQVFNLKFIIVTLILVLMFVMPSTLFDNIYSTYAFQGGLFVGIRSVFNFSIDFTITTHYVIETLPDIEVSTVILALLALAIEMGAAVFGYMRGKAGFVARHMKRDKDYRTDDLI